jgi:hypothetical protein
MTTFGRAVMIRKRTGQALIVLGLALIILSLFFRYDTCPSSTYNGTGPPHSGPACAPNYTWTETGFALLFGGVVLLPVGGFLALFRTWE